jgi:hypothetical protein
MTCRNPEMATRVVSYQELSLEERAAVDSHVAECQDCARTFWAIDRFVGKLRNTGDKRKVGVAHPPEEQIIQLAIDPKLLSTEQRAAIQRHFEHDRCATCERIYWSVLHSEKECAREPDPSPAVTFWQTFFLDWKKPAFALLLAFAILQGIEIGFFMNTRHRFERQEAEYRSRPAAAGPVAASSEVQPAQPAEESGTQTTPSKAPAVVQNQEREQTIADLQKKLQTYAKPSADAAYVLVLSAGRGPDSLPTVKLPESKLFVVLQANLSPELGQYKRYKLVLQNHAGKIVNSDQVTLQGGTLNYLVRKELLKPGAYTLQVSGRDGLQDHYLAQLPFRVAAATE